MPDAERLSALPATFTTGEALQADVHPRDLYRMRDQGDLLELSRGVFRRADAPVPRYPDLLAVAHRAPQAVVCLTSALAVHDLTDQVPAAVHIAVPRTARPPRIDHPPIEVSRFDVDTFELGVELVEAAEGERVRVYSAARTVVDVFRLRARLGESTALIALRRYVAGRDARVGELVEFARALHVAGPLRAALDVLTAS
ncbi:MAG: type IV toxin-antitoxin system AbiEi family antitoxin domain-containing protein [Actinopolymorphaceae bacterium]